MECNNKRIKSCEMRQRREDPAPARPREACLEYGTCSETLKGRTQATTGLREGLRKSLRLLNGGWPAIQKKAQDERNEKRGEVK